MGKRHVGLKLGRIEVVDLPFPSLPGSWAKLQACQSYGLTLSTPGAKRFGLNLVFENCSLSSLALCCQGCSKAKSRLAHGVTYSSRPCSSISFAGLPWNFERTAYQVDSCRPCQKAKEVYSTSQSSANRALRWVVMARYQALSGAVPREEAVYRSTLSDYLVMLFDCCAGCCHAVEHLTYQQHSGLQRHHSTRSGSCWFFECLRTSISVGGWYRRLTHCPKYRRPAVLCCS